MPKYLVETISYFRHRYVIDCKEEGHALDTVTCEEAEEMSQLHISEDIISSREIDDAEYLRVFNEDNDYLREWTDEQKFKFVHKVDYEESGRTITDGE
jgi:hypothetical protein